METRSRILVVEDDKTYRDTLVDMLGVGGFASEAAGTAAQALAAVDRLSFPVALIDIMLNGDDMSNRDGVKVLTYLRRLGESTRSFVLSGQPNVPFAIETLQEYGAVDYIDKGQFEGKGNAFLLSKIKGAIAATPPPKASDAWIALAKTLRGQRVEDQFVYECLETLGLKGGFANLSNSLLKATKYLVPLLPDRDAAVAGIGPVRAPDVFSGRFWSKGQGMAVELMLFGPSVSRSVESTWNDGERTILYERTQSGLSIVVLASPEAGREQFLPAPT